MDCQVTLLGHSGVLVQFADTVCLFDYYRGALPRAAFSNAKHAVVFASHAHRDHYNPQIHTLCQDNPATQFVLSSDIACAAAHHAISPGETLCVENLQIRAFASTDVGVSLLVNCGAFTLFHAGDLNLWSWREESTAEEIARAEADFTAVLRTLPPETVHLACFPLDRRMGQGYEEGLRQYCAAVKPRYVLPIHSFGDYRPAGQFSAVPPETTLLRPTQDGDRFELHF